MSCLICQCNGSVKSPGIFAIHSLVYSHFQCNMISYWLKCQPTEIHESYEDTDVNHHLSPDPHHHMCVTNPFKQLFLLTHCLQVKVHPFRSDYQKIPENLIVLILQLKVISFKVWGCFLCQNCSIKSCMISVKDV